MIDQQNSTATISPDIDPNTAPYTDRGYFGALKDNLPAGDPNTTPYTNRDITEDITQPIEINEWDDTVTQPIAVANGSTPVLGNEPPFIPGNTVVSAAHPAIYQVDAIPDPGLDNNNLHDPAKGATIGGVGGAIIGAIAGGPIGAVVGAIAGAAVSGAAVAGVDTFDADKSPGEVPPHIAGETPGQYTDRVSQSADVADANDSVI